MILFWFACAEKEEPDTEAPVITLKQTSIGLETGDQLIPGTLVLSITDNKDANPVVTAWLSWQPIPFSDAHTFAATGDFILKIKAVDQSGNSAASDVAVNVGTGAPAITGLESLQTRLNPMIDIPMDLLYGVNAIDVKDGDLTSKIKVYVKVPDGPYLLINDPHVYLVYVPGQLLLKYQVTDNSNQTTEVEKTLNVIHEIITVPQLYMIPTDPAFNANDPNWDSWSENNRTAYLKTVYVPEVRAMGEAMIRSGTNTFSKSDYLLQLNKRQVALNNANGIPIWTDADGQYKIPTTAFNPNPTVHEDICNQILGAKKNNGVGWTGIIGPLIQSGEVNKLIWMEDGRMENSRYHYPTQVKKRLQANPWKNLIISSSVNIGGWKDEIKELLQTGRLVWFQAGGNVRTLNGNLQSISVTEESYTWDDTKEFKYGAWSFSYGSDVQIPIQRVGGCWPNFEINIMDPSTVVFSAFLTWEAKDIRYAPGGHAYLQGWKLVAQKGVPTSYATPVQAGLFYLLAAAFPEKTPKELLELAGTKYSKPVKVDYAPNTGKGYVSKTIDIGKAYTDLNSLMPTTISLSSAPVPVQKGRYKFNIIHGEGVRLANGNKITNADVNDATRRGLLALENYFIDPAALKKMGKKAGDQVTLHVSVCSDAQEQYKQIWDIEYKVLLTN